MTPRERLMRFALKALTNRYAMVVSFADHIKVEYGLEGTTPAAIIAELEQKLEGESVRIT